MPADNFDNDAGSTLLYPEVGGFVALGGRADHLTEAVGRKPSGPNATSRKRG